MEWISAWSRIRLLSALVFRDEAQALQIAGRERADGGERLGSSSEVEGFRVEPRQGLLVEGKAGSPSPGPGEPPPPVLSTKTLRGDPHCAILNLNY